MLQDAFVSVAVLELRSSARDVAADAISVMTGVSPRYAREVLQTPDTVILGEAEQRINAAARVLVGWHTDRDYIGPYGLVRDLMFAPTDSQSKKDVSGFAELANRYCPNVSPKVLLR